MSVQFLDDETIKSQVVNNVGLRLRLLKSACGSSDFAEILKNKCKTDFFFWIEFFCHSYDPRPNAVQTVFPFVPYDYQVEDAKQIINYIDNGEDVLIEKSRDMGFTWLVCFIFQWYWQFKDGSNFLIGSKKLDNVDKQGDPSCIFEKIRFNIKKQPQFLLPAGFDAGKHLNFCRCVNPYNNNAIIGESCNSDFGRSGRYKAALFDEFAFWEQANLAWGSCSQSTLCRIALSTPFGKTNKFADLRFHSPIKKITRHWTSHPRKVKNLVQLEDGKFSSDWYEEQKQKMTSVEIARELDIDYLTSREGAVYNFKPKYHVQENLKEDVCKDKELVIHRIWDFGLNPAVLFFANTAYGPRLLRELVPDDKPTTNKLVTLVEYFSQKHFSGFKFDDACDVAGNQTNRQTNKTDIEILNEAGIYPYSDKVPIEDGITAVQSLLDRPDGLIIDSSCYNTIEAFEGGYYRKEDKTGENKEMPPVEIHPYEDVMDCVRYHIWRFFRPMQFTRKQNNSSEVIYMSEFAI